ncbi:hypothetical protein BU23DRAFT_581156 [Bimuria novae-zelandiae CBS 107.79]|uniref:LCCL domain-containing protein n=1 Tax=Bimuria novae-zelandiae CBS 107.79 TaxID=1447943 RepID=A0A6A5VA42_9PLEO|nr:hypothetical protein BU23DRAFT_581156 [Bimuria novae-zelandiae CBS 107.79]
MARGAENTYPADGDDGGTDVDEEAQLLQREELEVVDNIAARADFKQSPPSFPSAQKLLATWLNQHVPGRHQQAILLVVVFKLWLIMFIIILSGQRPIKDENGRSKNGCGINDIDCCPFNNVSFPFCCPAKCASVKALNPRAVGHQDVNYRPLVIGDETYWGDSFICGSAIHAGVFSDVSGGCGRVTLLGSYNNFSSVEKHGIESILFDLYFLLHCLLDSRQVLLFLDIFFTRLLSIFSTSPSIFFLIFIIVFAHVSFASDPPSALYRNTTVLPDHISMFAKRLLPALFCAVVIYRTTVKRTLRGLTAYAEKTALWLGGFFFSALSNYIFDWIPIQRLTAHNLKQQPGAKVALAIILFVLAVIIACQVYYYWLEARLLCYLALYGLFTTGILVCLVIPGVSLQIHHYVIALLLLPGTSLQTRPFLVIARWDFNLVLQTTADLREDGKFDSARPAEMHLNEYLRFGYIKGGQALDFTAAGTLFSNRI